MSQRSDVPPATLAVEIDDGVIQVDYIDGRRVTYSVPPEAAEGEVRCRPGKDVHVLVTDADGAEGVLVYVNDHKTHDDILEDSGVGRVLLSPGESTELFPGVSVRLDSYNVVVASTGAAAGRVFVFEEDEMGERAFEVRAEG